MIHREMTTALLLGAAVWPDGPSPTLRRRTAHAARLFAEGRVDRIVACGGLGLHPPTEAAVMAGLLIADGVPPESIVQEDRSHTTVENIANALPLLAPGERRVVVVTDLYHAPRACLIVRRHGVLVTADCPPPRVTFGYLRQCLREAPATIHCALTCWPGPRRSGKR